MNIQQLANELAGTLEQFKPEKIRKKRDQSKLPPSQLYKRNRERYIKWKRSQPVTKRMTNYGKIRIKVLFLAIAKHYGITQGAAMMKYYRKQIPARTLNKIRKEME